MGIRGRLPSMPGHRLLRATRAFLETEASSGVILLVAAAIALVWINSAWQDAYVDLWHTEVSVDLGVWSLTDDLQEWVNEGLMTLFFFVVGVEIKRELDRGELSTPRRAALPAIAAAGGMIAPALIYVAFNLGGDGERGWGIPMATDIAFAVGVLSLTARQAPIGLRIFLLALAIVDDIGAIAVIAVFYTESVDIAALGVAAGFLGGLVVLNRFGVRNVLPYIGIGVLLWAALIESGVHATLAGVATGLLIPSNPQERGASPVDRLDAYLRPIVSYAIVPLFALANAGVILDSDSIEAAASSPVTAGVAAGLVLGKPAGILLLSAAAVRLGVCEPPEGTGWRHVLGAGLIAGIGFTVSLFITNLAFEDAALIDEAKIGILAGSLVSAIAGLAVMRYGIPSPRPK
jgi:NhaA family Na+:H+ antiporter